MTYGNGDDNANDVDDDDNHNHYKHELEWFEWYSDNLMTTINYYVNDDKVHNDNYDTTYDKLL